MYVHQFDIRIAFLNGGLVEEIYMIQTEGYVQLGEMTLVCRFKKSLYDLKQTAPCNGTSSFTHS
jgi:hypothetical protein